MSSSDCCPTDAPKVVQPGKKKLLARLNRIEGQVRGVIKMVDEDRYCVDVLTQISAIKSAMDSVAMQLLENHAHGCVAKAIQDGEGDAAIDELMLVVKKLSGKTLG
ncbi:metal-sensitive transcriptional regulator [Iodobacter sp.]|uniref:metal-sensitive transcriptional regulator n=1 Tax=Iodobacter sp. TaxID=1915058 RepID=UPI0035B5BD58